jgi:magnesium-transporting ATPase (P-type)
MYYGGNKAYYDNRRPYRYCYAIARELGILTDGMEAITGTQIDAMSDEEFTARFMNISVYARVQPEHKTRIVNACAVPAM